MAALWYFLKQYILLDIAYEKVKSSLSNVSTDPVLTLISSSTSNTCNPYKIPDFFFGSSIVLLPISELKWVISQPLTVVDYTFTLDDVVHTAEVLWNGDYPYNKGELVALGFPALWISKGFNEPKNTIYSAV